MALADLLAPRGLDHRLPRGRGRGRRLSRFARAWSSALLLWQTNRILTDQVLATLRARGRAAHRRGAVGRPAALVRAVEARSRPGGPGLYFPRRRVRHQARRQSEPHAARDRRQRRGRRVPLRARRAERSSAHLGVAIPVDLGGGMRLIVGRDVEEQRRFADEMGTLYFLGARLPVARRAARRASSSAASR